MSVFCSSLLIFDRHNHVHSVCLCMDTQTYRHADGQTDGVQRLVLSTPREGRVQIGILQSSAA